MVFSCGYNDLVMIQSIKSIFRFLNANVMIIIYRNFIDLLILHILIKNSLLTLVFNI